MAEQIKWRIYYDDGSTFDSNQGDPSEAPALGFICVVQYNVHGIRIVHQGFDFYYWHKPSQQFWGSDLFGVLDQFMQKPNDVIALKAGRNLRDEAYNEIMCAAINDPDFIVK